MPRIDLSDGQRTAESVLAVPRENIPDVVGRLLRERRLSSAVESLNELSRDPAYGDLGRRALRHLGFREG